MHSEHPQIVYHFGCIEYLSTVGESDRIAQLIQSTPSQSPFDVEIRDTVNYISKATNIDNRQGVYATVIEMLTVSVPSCPPEQGMKSKLCKIVVQRRTIYCALHHAYQLLLLWTGYAPELLHICITYNSLTFVQQITEKLAQHEHLPNAMFYRCFEAMAIVQH